MIVTDHGSHFQNSMMTKLTTMLGFRQEHSSSFYPPVNGQVEAVNKTLKTILKRTINAAHSNWHIMLYPTFWAYRTNVKLLWVSPPSNSFMEWKQLPQLSVKSHL